MTRSVATLQAKRQDIPDIKIVSPFKRPAYLSDISVLVDPSFVRFGAMRVEIGQVKIHEAMPGELQNIQGLKIQTAGRSIERQGEIDIWVWSPAGNPVSATFVVAIELTAQAASQVLTAADQAELNALVADTLELTTNTAGPWAAKAAAIAAEPRPGKAYVFSNVFGEGVRQLLRQAGTLGFDLGLQKTLVMAIEGLRTQDNLYRMARAARGDSPTGLSRSEIQDILTGADDPWRLVEPWLSRVEALGRELAALGETLPVPNTDDKSLFPFTVYTDESHARLINMKGAKNLIVSMSASEVTPPAQVLPNPAPPTPDPGATLTFGGRPTGVATWRGTVAHYADTVTMPTNQVYARAIYDMVSPHGSVMRPSFTGGSATVSITDTAGNPVSYLGWAVYDPPPSGRDYGRYEPRRADPVWSETTEAFESDVPRWGDASERQLTCANTNGRWRCGEMTKRYLLVRRGVRLVGWNVRQLLSILVHRNSRGPGAYRPPGGGTIAYTGNLDGLNVRDDVSHGGAGKVSFEVRDNRGTWRELIPARAIAQGDDQVVRYGAEQGDHTLPSGPNILRARLDVANGLQTGVSVIIVE